MAMYRCCPRYHILVSFSKRWNLLIGCVCDVLTVVTSFSGLLPFPRRLTRCPCLFGICRGGGGRGKGRCHRTFLTLPVAPFHPHKKYNKSGGGGSVAAAAPRNISSICRSMGCASSMHRLSPLD